MSLHSTIFSPALNGSIPELYPAEYVITANGIIRMVTTAAILAGTALGGVILDIEGTIGNAPAGRAAAAFTVVAVAVVGVIVSFGVPRFPAASPNARFPWSGPIDTIRTFYQTRQDPLLFAAIIAKAFFWGIGALQIQLINQLGLRAVQTFKYYDQRNDYCRACRHRGRQSAGRPSGERRKVAQSSCSIGGGNDCCACSSWR